MTKILYLQDYGTNIINSFSCRFEILDLHQKGNILTQKNHSIVLHYYWKKGTGQAQHAAIPLTGKLLFTRIQLSLP